MKCFYSIEDFLFLKDILKNIDTIEKEYSNYLKYSLKFVDKNHNLIIPDPNTVSWIKQQKNNEQYYNSGKNSDNWVVISLFKTKFLNKRYFSETHKLLKSVRRLNYSGFFNLKSGKSIPYHKHKINTFILHINLYDLKGGAAYTYVDSGASSPMLEGDHIRCYERKMLKNKDDYVIFTPRMYHCAKNKSDVNRITFAVEFYE